jgi:ABC-type antimicrobial peptide transport system permease subunit
MQRAIPPIIMLNVRLIPTYRFLSFKLKPGNIGRSIEAIQKKWAALLPGSSFEYRFMDDALRKVYASELQIKKAASTATVLALVIVLLGVLGLLSLSVQKRTKEIGILKVLGASLSSIISLFLKEFLPVLLVGGLVAIPISLYFMKGWLNNYAYRIELSALPFLMTLFLLVLVTSLLIILKVVRASTENPVKNLRTE